MKSTKKVMLVLSALNSLSVFADTSSPTAPVVDAVQSTASSASSASIAAPSAGASTTTISADGSAPKKSPAILKFNNYFYGGPVARPLSNQQPDVVTGEQNGGGIVVESHIRTGVRLSSNLDLTLNPQFSSTASSAKSGVANDPVLLKPIASYVRLGVGSFYKVGKFNWGGEFRAYAPVTDDLKAGKTTDKHIMYYRTHQNFTYDLNSKISLASINVIRAYQRPNGFREGKKLYSFESVLGATYHASDAVDLNLSYDMVAHNNYGDHFLDYRVPAAGGTDTSTYLEIGADFSVSKLLTISPYIDMSTGEHVDENNSRIGATVSMNIL